MTDVSELEERLRAVEAKLEKLRVQQNHVGGSRKGPPSEAEARNLVALADRGAELVDERTRLHNQRQRVLLGAVRLGYNPNL